MQYGKLVIAMLYIHRLERWFAQFEPGSMRRQHLFDRQYIRAGALLLSSLTLHVGLAQDLQTGGSLLVAGAFLFREADFSASEAFLPARQGSNRLQLGALIEHRGEPFPSACSEDGEAVRWRRAVSPHRPLIRGGKLCIYLEPTLDVGK